MLEEALRRWKASGIWVKAKQLSSRGRHAEALELVQGVDEITRRKIHWRLFEVQQLSLLKDYDRTLHAAEAFIASLSEAPTHSPDERYFLALAQWYGKIAFCRLHPSKNVPSRLETNLGGVSLQQVAPRWRRAFPMPIHPEWNDAKAAAPRS